MIKAKDKRLVPNSTGRMRPKPGPESSPTKTAIAWHMPRTRGREAASTQPEAGRTPWAQGDV